MTEADGTEVKKKKEETGEQQDEGQKDEKTGGETAGGDSEFNDRELARLLLVIEESLSGLLNQAVMESFSGPLQSMLDGFTKESVNNRREIRDLMVRHGWFKPEPAKKSEFEKLLQEYKNSAPPVL